RWLLFVPLMQTIISIQGTAVVASDKPVLTSWLGLLRLILTLAAGVGLTLAFGVVGMAIALTGGVFVSFVVFVIVIRAVVGIPLLTLWGYREIVGLASAYIAGFGAANLVQSRLSGIAGLAVALIIGA